MYSKRRSHISTHGRIPYLASHRSGRSISQVWSWSVSIPRQDVRCIFLLSIYLQPATPLASVRIPRLNLAKVSSATLAPRSLDAERLLSPGVFLRLSIAVNLGELHDLAGAYLSCPGAVALSRKRALGEIWGNSAVLSAPSLHGWLLPPPPPSPTSHTTDVGDTTM